MMKHRNLLVAASMLFAVHVTAAPSSLSKGGEDDLFQPYKNSTLRLPSVSLLVNDPYFSFWSPFDKLTDGSVRHWTDAEKPTASPASCSPLLGSERG